MSSTCDRKYLNNEECDVNVLGHHVGRTSKEIVEQFRVTSRVIPHVSELLLIVSTPGGLKIYIICKIWFHTR